MIGGNGVDTGETLKARDCNEVQAWGLCEGTGVHRESISSNRVKRVSE